MCFQTRHAFESFGARQKTAGKQIALTGNQIVHLHPDPVISGARPGIHRNQKVRRMCKMRSIGQHVPALPQRALYHPVLFQIEAFHRLFQVTHTTVHEFGGSARSSGREVTRIQ
jgi:hypothetical protein